MKNIFFLSLLLFFVIISCKTGEVREVTTLTTEETKEEVTEEKTVVKEETPKTVTPAAAEDVKIVKEEKTNGHSDKRFNFVIDDKLTSDQLNEMIGALFIAIEEKIATGDFDGWYQALSYRHRMHISDKSVLLTMSKESDYLYSRNIVLASPRDYFLNIVVPSRKGSSLKYVNYDYINKNHIKVNCVLDERIKFVYDFIYEEGSWKVDRR